MDRRTERRAEESDTQIHEKATVSAAYLDLFDPISCRDSVAVDDANSGKAA